MPHPRDEPCLSPPDWPHCGHGTTPEDPVGCRGIHVPAHTACLLHLSAADRDAYLTGLVPGASVDHRGTPFTQPLLDALLAALRDPVTGQAHLGHARFDAATFHGAARFDSAVFDGEARFHAAVFHDAAGFGGATFQSDAGFHSTTFHHAAEFHSATFQSAAWFDSTFFQGAARFHAAIFVGSAWFDSAVFHGAARFHSARCHGAARFDSATFQHAAWFDSATFHGVVRFHSVAFQNAVWLHSATFHGSVWFEDATFERSVSLGPLVCAGRVVLSGAVFSGPMTLSLAARRLECRRTRWSATADLRLRYASADLTHAVFEYPLTISAEAEPFALSNGRSVTERALADASSAAVQLASLRGVDAAHLSLADVDLSGCLFIGTVHLDQLRLEGTCLFDVVPPRRCWRRWHPVRFAQRRVLAEEQHWRADQPAAVRGWNTAVLGAGRVGPAELAPVYRALRKAFEDSKNEPGAADFYYGEMEMRRHDHATTRAERGLLCSYWLLSGYGLRASRALGWLAVAMFLTVMLLMGVGLPQDTPQQEATGALPPGGGTVTFEIDSADPQNPTSDRFSGKRFEKALNITLNSVVFRSSGQNLTTTGTYIEMFSRVTEPVLLGLAVLAVRNRVKR
ncbi:pentapeptide repeat-containing protein [Streptomyces olivaceus]